MASDKLSRDPGQGGDEPSEGVRIIAADELEEAADRAEVAHRRPKDEPRYGDRPPAPSPDVEPTIRFPLPDSADLSAIERPRPAPVDPPRAEGSADRTQSRPMPDLPDVEVTPVSLGDDEADGPQVIDLVSEESVFDAAADEPKPNEAKPDEAKPDEVKRDGPTADLDEPEETILGALTLEELTLDDRPPPPDAASVSAESDDQPVLDLAPSTGENALPHWTAPPTGEVPKVVIGDLDDDEEERWASFTANSTRWRDEHDVSDHGDLMADLAATDDEPVSERLGALDTSERVEDDAYLNFDDVELDPRKPTRGPSRWSRSRAPRTPTDSTSSAGTDAAPPPASTPDAPGPPSSAAPTGASSTSPAASNPIGSFDDASLAPEPSGARPPRRPRVRIQSDAPPDDDPAAPRRRRRPATGAGGSGAATGASGRDLPQAIAVGAALALVALLAFVAGPAPTMILVEIVIAIAGVEYFLAVQRGGFRPATLLGLVAVAAFPVATYWKGEAAFPTILFLSFVVGVLWYLLGVGGKARPTANLGVTMLGIVWVGVLGSFAALILKIPSQGVSILLVAVVAVVANDTGAFFIGRAMGRTPLSATSPNKTVEGLFGGVVASLVAVFVVTIMLGFGPFSSSEALVFGLIVAVVAPLGDLAESLFKRDLGIKDMGSLLPEHGGVLDRFDGMLFVLPAAYYVVRVLGLAG